MWILTVRSPNTKPTDHSLKNGKNTLGRKGDNDIVIIDESASRLHAEIEVRDDRVVILDLGSTNGTFVNQKRLTEPQPLRSGDQIRIGYHLATLVKNGFESPIPTDQTATGTHPLTPDFLLESYEQNAVLIYDVANRLSTVLNLEKALEEISQFLKIAIGAEKCQVVVKDQFDSLHDLGFPESIAIQAINSCSVVIYPDPKHQKNLSDSARLLKMKSALCVPILYRGETVALVYAYKTDSSTRYFDQNDLQLSVAVSHQAALAIQRNQILVNARILERWALTDSLTGLDNRRHILIKGEIECSRSNRFNHPLSILMLDIDDFKEINDNYGHMIGDQVIKAIAELLKSQLRDIDLLGRYGGDEFLILLVETGIDKAVLVATRIQQSIESQPIDTDRGEFNMTVSLGITCTQEQKDSFPNLIQRADDALLASKKRGKNHYEVLCIPE
jgi:diguanylate cyclase (GGDEF)-like protein